MRVRCPTCVGPVYAPDDSNRDRVDCSGCGTELVTRRDLAGEVTVELAPDLPALTDAEIEATYAREIAAVRELPGHEPEPGWQERVLAAVAKTKEPK